METENREVTLADIQTHTKRHGRKATSQLLTLLGKRRPLYDIVMSKGGQRLFSVIIERLDELLDRIINNKATTEETIEYRVSVDFLNYSASILSNYEKHSNKLKGVK